MARLEIRYDLRNPSFAEVSLADRYEAALDQIVWAEERGFRAVTLSEHHGTTDDYLPSALVFAAAVAARTYRIKIRIAAVVAALHDPLRLAEEAAVVDQLSRGRLELAVANGYVDEELTMFGRDKADRVPAVVEAVATLKDAWTGEPFIYRDRTVRVTPRPYRQPRPPILLGGASEGAARRAARIADVFLPSKPEHWEPYRQAVVDAGGPDWGAMPPLGPRFVAVHENPDTAWAEIAPYVTYDRDSYGAWSTHSGSNTGYEAVADVAPIDDPEYRVVTPAAFQGMVEALGPTGTLAVHPMMGGIPPELSWVNLRNIAAALGLEPAQPTPR
ncbi:MAG: LLM class flavin-dependent oxidoreductase [Aquihabitans sp.]